jgi:hypothetical protein
MTIEDSYDYYLKHGKPVRIVVSLTLSSNEGAGPMISLEASVDLGDDGVFTSTQQHSVKAITEPIDYDDLPITDAISAVIDAAIDDHEPLRFDDTADQAIVVEIDGLYTTIKLPDGYRHVKHGRIKKGDCIYDDSGEWYPVDSEMIGDAVVSYYPIARARRVNPHATPTHDDL